MRSGVCWLWLRSTMTGTIVESCSRSSCISTGLASAARSASAASPRIHAPRMPRQSANTVTITEITASAISKDQGRKGVKPSVMSLSQAFQEVGDVHLVGFVVTGQHVHHDVDAGAEGIFPLNFVRR